MQEEVSLEWEKRSADTPMALHMIGSIDVVYLLIAGSFAGILEHTSMLPLDNLKTKLQVRSEATFREILQEMRGQRILNLYSGVFSIAGGCVPAHAAYFSMYEYLQMKFDVTDEEHHPIQFAVIGALATFAHEFILTPFDVIKQRQQIVPLKMKQVLRMLIKKEGIISLYRSFPITYVMGAPNQAIIISANETLKRLMSKRENHNFFSYFLCGGMAGALASCITCPLDVIKTKLQTQTYYQHFLHHQQFKCESNLKNFQSGKFKNAIKYYDIKSTIKLVIKEEGVKGFYRGVVPRICMQMPSSAIAWSSYEMLKKLLTHLTRFDQH